MLAPVKVRLFKASFPTFFAILLLGGGLIRHLMGLPYSPDVWFDGSGFALVAVIVFFTHEPIDSEQTVP